MQKIIAASIVAVAIALSVAQLHAAPAGMTTRQNVAPPWRAVQAGYYYGGYRPACQYGYYYACRYDPYYGHEHCGCWPYWHW